MTASETTAGVVPWVRESELFTSGAEGYDTFRIPALAVAPDGTILAFCEGRERGVDDFYAMDLVLKRSEDNGATWGDLQLLIAGGENTMHNPTVVVDTHTNTVWLAFCKDIYEAYLIKSTDSGATWSDPIDISGEVRQPTWSNVNFGPGHGIQLRNGRLVLPGDHIVGTRGDWIFDHSHLVYSDDHGASWKVGGSTAGPASECEAVETQDGSLYLDVRSMDRRITNRVSAWSQDMGAGWSDLVIVDDLPDPHCQGSIVRFTDEDRHDKDRILFSNLASTTARENITLRVSHDECRTWAVSKVLYAGPAAYSDLAIASDMTVCCLYERGVSDPYESIRLAQFNLEWLTGGADHLE